MPRLWQWFLRQHWHHHPTAPPLCMGSHVLLRWPCKSLPTTTKENSTTMGKHIPPHKDQWPLLAWWPPSSCGRLTLKEGGNFSLPRPTYSWTPWYCKHKLGHSMRLLVAKHETHCNRVHQGMHHLPILKKQPHKTETTLIPHPLWIIHPSFHVHSPRLHYKTSPLWHIQYYCHRVPL